MAAVARVSRKIPTPRPRPTELRENTILFLLSRLNESQDHAADRRRGSTLRWLSAACSSLSDWHRLLGAYGICSEIKLAIPEIQLIECEFHRLQKESWDAYRTSVTHFSPPPIVARLSITPLWLRNRRL